MRSASVCRAESGAFRRCHAKWKLASFVSIAALLSALPACGEIDLEELNRSSSPSPCTPNIELQPREIDLGIVAVNAFASSSFQIRSSGCAPLRIDRITVAPSNVGIEISTAVPTPERPGLLEPGAQVSLTLRGHAEVSGAIAARVIVESNAIPPARMVELAVHMTVR